MNKRLLLFFLFFLSGVAFSQTFDNLYIEPGFNYGHLTPFDPSHASIGEAKQWNIDIRIGQQTYGLKRWQQELNHPSFGLQLDYEHNTLNDAKYIRRNEQGEAVTTYESLGDCIGISGFLNGSFYKSRIWSLDYDIIYGMDIWTRCHNEFIGARCNFHVSFDLGPTFRLSDRFDLALRYIYIHSSDGAIRLPDYGVNSHNARLAVRYRLTEPKETIKKEYEPFAKTWNAFVSEGVGFLQTYTTQGDQIPGETPMFFGNTIRVGVTRQFSPKFIWDAGLDFLWTGETKMRYEMLGEPYNFWRSTHIAASADFEILFGRFAFCAGLAYYLHHGIYSGTNEKKTWSFGSLSEFEQNHLPQFYTNYYERVGYKLYLGKNNRHYIGTFMKIHLNSIDYIEWTYGFRI